MEKEKEMTIKKSWLLTKRINRPKSPNSSKVRAQKQGTAIFGGEGKGKERKDERRVKKGAALSLLFTAMAGETAPVERGLGKCVHETLP